MAGEGWWSRGGFETLKTHEPGDLPASVHDVDSARRRNGRTWNKTQSPVPFSPAEKGTFNDKAGHPRGARYIPTALRSSFLVCSGDFSSRSQALPRPGDKHLKLLAVRSPIHPGRPLPRQRFRFTRGTAVFAARPRRMSKASIDWEPSRPASMLWKSWGRTRFRSVTESVFVSDYGEQLNIRLPLDQLRQEVVVTASTTPLTVEQTSKALDVVDRSQIDARGEYSLAESLRLIPGVRVRQQRDPGGNTGDSDSRSPVGRYGGTARRFPIA